MSRKRYIHLTIGVLAGNILGLALTTYLYQRSWVEFATSLLAIIAGMALVVGVTWFWTRPSR